MVAEEGETKQQGEPARAEHHGDQTRRRRHGRQPEQAEHGTKDHGRRRARRQHDVDEDRRRTAEINPRQNVAFGHEGGEPAGPDRTDDVEEPDDAECPAANLGRQASVHEISRQMHRDEEYLKAAGEKSEHQQHVAPVAESLGERLHHRLLRHGGSRRRRPGVARQCQRQSERHDQQHDGAENDQRMLPAVSLHQGHRERGEQELSERARRSAGAEGERAPFRRHQLAERTDHDGEGGAGEPEADHHAGGEMKHPGGRSVGHRRQADRIEDRSHAQHRHRPEAVRHPSGEGLGGAPEQHLNREREREHVAPPAVFAGHRDEKESEPGAHPKAEDRDQATAHEDDGGRAPTLATDDGRRTTDFARISARFPLHRRRLSSPQSPFNIVRLQAAAGATRTTGFSTIGRLMTADSTPNRMASHHTAS